MWCEKRGGKRAQVSGTELVVAYFIFFLVLALVITRWSDTFEVIEDSERLYELEDISSGVAEKLVRTGGVPLGWGKGNVSVIGLSDEARILNPGKVLDFVDMMNDSAFSNPCTDVSNYECNKHMLGVGGYDFYFILRDINGTTIEIGNVSCITGREPSDEIEKVTVTRTAILNDEIVRMVLMLWHGE